jgi:hypothetical protein
LQSEGAGELVDRTPHLVAIGAPDDRDRIVNGLDLTSSTGQPSRTSTGHARGHLDRRPAMWLTHAADRRLAVALAVLIPIYVAAFYVGDLAIRAVTGAVLMIAIFWVLVWVWRATHGGRSLPGLAVALGLTTFTYGAIIGVLQVRIPRPSSSRPAATWSARTPRPWSSAT